MLRAVIDTNVLLSALLWRGAPHEVLARPKFAVPLERAQIGLQALMAQLHVLLEAISPPALLQPVCRDPDDNAVLALALAARADVLISGDDDLLSLGAFAGIPIMTVAQALERLQPAH